MPTKKPDEHRYCGRRFSIDEIEIIRAMIAGDDQPNRARLSRMVCEKFNWRRPGGLLKDMSCRVAMLKMHRAGLITLPPPHKTNANGRRRPRLTTASEPRPPIEIPMGQLGQIELRQVRDPRDSRLWNELIERHHYLGYEPLAGAQIRYFVFAGAQLLAALGFGASAWTVAPRDRFIGWTPDQRRLNLNLVVNNARYLIMPWVRSKNLASHLLSRIARRLPHDWQARYGYRPVLLETFVGPQYPGTCYQAANWIEVGKTQGRGKLDRKKLCPVPIKRIYLYPLCRNYRQQLCHLDHSMQRASE